MKWFVRFILLIWSVGNASSSVTVQSVLAEGLESSSDVAFHVLISVTNPQDSSHLPASFQNVSIKIAENNLTIHLEDSNSIANLSTIPIILTTNSAGRISFSIPIYQNHHFGLSPLYIQYNTDEW